MADKPNFLNSILQGLGLAKPEEPKPTPARPARKPAQSGDLMLSTRQTDALSSKSTSPLSEEERQKEAEDRRYLIQAYQTNPGLIPEFQNPQYMYKLISNEREYIQERLTEKLREHKYLRSKSTAGVATPEEEARLKAMDMEIQMHRNELTKLFLLIKKITGVTKSGTGGTNFLPPA